MSENNCEKCKGKPEAVCLDCLQQNLVDWRPLKSLFFYDKTEGFKDRINPGLKCKKCRKQVDVCSKCYNQYILEYLKQEYPRLVEEFLVFFL